MNQSEIEVKPLAEAEVEILESRLRRHTSETHHDRFVEQESGETTYLIAWAGSEPAGYARLKWRPTFMMGLALRETPTIGDVTVRPDLRSSGIGNKIMQAAEDLARSKGFKRLALGVGIDNPRAIELYHRRGYFDAGISPERSRTYLLSEGEWWHEGEECICLFKELEPTNVLRVTGRAKINLMHKVGPRRRDGYHSVRTIMQSISLADELTFTPGGRTGVSIAWAAGLDGELPNRPDLVEKVLAKATRRSPAIKGLEVRVVKRIPIGAGLGGGSADAAAMLRALGEFDGETFNEEVLGRMARPLGADVKFCLKGGLALGTGVGAKLKQLDCPTSLWWVVGIPHFSLSTEQVYARFDLLAEGAAESSAGAGGSLVGVAGSRLSAAGVMGLTRALGEGDLAGIACKLRNDLEPAAFDLAPTLQGLKQAMLEAGARASVMSGSGSAILGLCSTEGDATAVAHKARSHFRRVEVAVSTKTGAEVVGVSSVNLGRNGAGC